MHMQACTQTHRFGSCGQKEVKNRQWNSGTVEAYLGLPTCSRLLLPGMWVCMCA